MSIVETDYKNNIANLREEVEVIKKSLNTTHRNTSIDEKLTDHNSRVDNNTAINIMSLVGYPPPPPNSPGLKGQDGRLSLLTPFVDKRQCRHWQGASSKNTTYTNWLMFI